MNFRSPIQANPILRSNHTIGNKIEGMQGVTPSIDWTCAIECAASLAKCAFSSNKAQCLISAGMGKCLKCL